MLSEGNEDYNIKPVSMITNKRIRLRPNLDQISTNIYRMIL